MVLKYTTHDGMSAVCTNEVSSLHDFAILELDVDQVRIVAVGDHPNGLRRSMDNDTFFLNTLSKNLFGNLLRYYQDEWVSRVPGEDVEIGHLGVQVFAIP